MCHVNLHRSCSLHGVPQVSLARRLRKPLIRSDTLLSRSSIVPKCSRCCSLQLESRRTASRNRDRCTGKGAHFVFREVLPVVYLQIRSIYLLLQARKSAPLARGGTLSGERAAGKVCKCCITKTNSTWHQQNPNSKIGLPLFRMLALEPKAPTVLVR